ncbi:MAG: hypothetical protein IJI43_03835 [Bacilli bacterium]|nr:hypothetical protein [Bacilli bacterium]
MKKIYNRKQILLFTSLLVFIFIGIVCLVYGYNNKKIISIKYKENNNIDYKVYLKDNKYFESKYIEKGKTYITSLIDHIHIDYHYETEYDKKVNGNYKYKVVAQIEANKSNNEVGNYWTKKYDVTNYREEKVKNIHVYNINQSIDVDYNKYNSLLESFKKEVGLTNSEGVLKVYLEVNSTIENEEISAPINNKLILKLPLSKLAIEASIDSDVNNKVKTVSNIVKDKDPKYLIATLIGMISIAIALLNLWIILRNRRVYEINNKYELALNKILTTYDSIIVNIKEMPNTDEYNVIKVESFEELIDAHSEIRMPINHYQTNDRSIFLLLNDKTLWEYVLDKKHLRGIKK